MRTRLVLAVAGIAVGLYGVARLLIDVPTVDLVMVGLWLVGMVVVHDGVLSPLVVAVGVLLAKVPPRARRALQAALIVGALITVIAIPLIYRRGSQPPIKTLVVQDYGLHLTVLLGLVAAGSLGWYAVRVARDRAPR